MHCKVNMLVCLFFLLFTLPAFLNGHEYDNTPFALFERICATPAGKCVQLFHTLNVYKQVRSLTLLIDSRAQKNQPVFKEINFCEEIIERIIQRYESNHYLDPLLFFSLSIHIHRAHVMLFELIGFPDDDSLCVAGSDSHPMGSRMFGLSRGITMVTSVGCLVALGVGIWGCYSVISNSLITFFVGEEQRRLDAVETSLKNGESCTQKVQKSLMKKESTIKKLKVFITGKNYMDTVAAKFKKLAGHMQDCIDKLDEKQCGIKGNDEHTLEEVNKVCKVRIGKEKKSIKKETKDVLVSGRKVSYNAKQHGWCMYEALKKQVKDLKEKRSYKGALDYLVRIRKKLTEFLHKLPSEKVPWCRNMINRVEIIEKGLKSSQDFATFLSKSPLKYYEKLFELDK